MEIEANKKHEIAGQFEVMFKQQQTILHAIQQQAQQ